MDNATDFKVGDAVDVLSAIWLPKERVTHTGTIERITTAPSGHSLYWVSGCLVARTSRTLRPKGQDTL